MSAAVRVTVPAFAAVVAAPTVVACERSSRVEYLNDPVVERRAGFNVTESEAVVVVTDDASARVTTGATAVTVKLRVALAGA